MKRGEHLLHLLEEPHTPLNDPSAPRDWKEWYHYVLIDPASGTRVLANVSLAGIPAHGQIIATVIVTREAAAAEASAGAAGQAPASTGGQAAAKLGGHPGAGSDRRGQAVVHGYSSDREWAPEMVRIGPLRIETDDVRFEAQGPRSRFESRDRYGQVSLAFSGTATAMPVLIPEFSPFGSGFIGWGLVPGVRVEGRLELDGRGIAIDERWFCYHDHNYGRFRWGEDIGWIWFVASVRTAAGEPYTLVLHRGNNRDATRCGAPYLFVYEGDTLRKVFMGDAVHLSWRWSAERRRPPRLPGAMATLFAERTLLLPTGLELRAADERDALHLELSGDSNTELVLPDNRDRQYTFIEECTGQAAMQCRIGGAERSAQGHFYAEFVH